MDAIALVITFACVALAFVLGRFVGASRPRQQLDAANSLAAEAQAAATGLQGQVTALTDQLAVLRQQAHEQARLQDVLQPIQEQLTQLRTDATQADLKRAAADAAITEQIQSLATGSEGLRAETARLAGALAKGQSRGQWGEMQLERLLESAGLLEEIHFRRQSTSATETGRKRPDIVVLLPGGGEVLVDAKFPFDRYAESLAADDPGERDRFMKEHVAAVLGHCRDLASRDYYTGRVTPQFIVLFLPYESLLSDALACEPLLLERAFSHNIVLATPTTMLALLRTIGHGWSQQSLAENALRIQELGREMLDRLSTMLGFVTDVGSRLRQGVDSYNKLVGSLEGRVLVTARRMQEMGVTTDRTLTAPAALPDQVRVSRELPPADPAHERHEPGQTDHPNDSPASEAGAGFADSLTRSADGMDGVRDVSDKG